MISSDDEIYDDEFDLEYVDQDDDFGGAGDNPAENTCFQVTTLTSTLIRDEMADIVQKAKSSLPPEITLDAIKLALNFNAWNSQDLVSNTFNHPDGEEAYFSSLKVPFGPSPIIPETVYNPNVFGIKFVEEPPSDCIICGIESESENIFTHRCGAKICTPCWKEYIRSEIVDNNRSSLTCPSCPLYLEARLVEELSGDEGIRRKLQSSVLEGFLQKSKYHQRCPAPDCQLIFRLEDPTFAGWKPGLCGCGSVSCLDCGTMWHGPMDCATTARWKGLLDNNDAETQRWLLMNSKPCPKCSTAIEKNGGCNFMQCTNPSCRYKFCWICLEKAHDHSFGETCTKFKTPPKSSNAVTQAKLDHDRYIYYCSRYQNMLSSVSLDHDRDVGGVIAKKKEALIKSGGQGAGTHELAYLDEIASVLKRSKLTLAHSYAMLYLTTTSGVRDCFEESLTFLQVKVEGLSVFLQHELPKITCTSEISRFVHDSVNFCKKEVQSIESMSESNFKAGAWTFMPEENVASTSSAAPKKKK